MGLRHRVFSVYERGPRSGARAYIMCGRFTLTKPPDTITRHFATPAEATEFQPRYNIAPLQTVHAVRMPMEGGGRELIEAQWGLIPAWSRDPKSGLRPINAKAETLTARPMFRESFQHRRCLIPADGFYEWQVVGKRKQPWYIHRKDDDLFAFGGLWEGWQDPFSGNWVTTCAIVTTPPNELLAPVHDRMPLIIAKSDYDTWLSPAHAPPPELLRPFATGA